MSTTTHDVRTPDRARTGSLGAAPEAAALALVAQRPAPLTGVPRLAPIAGGPGGEVRPELDGRGVPCVLAVRGDRDRRPTTSRHFIAPSAVAVSGAHRPLRSCGTPVPGSAPTGTAT